MALMNTSRPEPDDCAWQPPDGDFGAYIFDCDGTLAATMSIHHRSWLHAIHRQIGDAFTLDWRTFCSMGGMSAGDTLRALREKFGISLDEARLNADVDAFLETALDKAQPRPQALALARRALDAGIKIAVASGGRRTYVERTLRAIGAAKLFPVVVTLDDVARAKPAPDLFLLAAQRLGVEPARCLVIEDSVQGVTAAGAAHMSCLVVEPQ